MLSESRPLGCRTELCFDLQGAGPRQKWRTFGRPGSKKGGKTHRSVDIIGCWRCLLSFKINFSMGVKINMKHEDHSISLCHSSYETLMVNMMKILDQET